MAERNYNGPVIDCTWSNGPWSNDGETIEASDDNAENGNMSTIAWPEGATPKEELTHKQQKIIETAARYPTLSDPYELYYETELTKHVSKAYPAQVLTAHWREWLSGKEYSTSDNNHKTEKHGSPGEENPRAKINEEDVKEMRARAKNGDTISNIALDFPVGETAVGDAIRGVNWSHVDTIPPLNYNEQRGYHISEEDADESLNLTTEEMRQRALGGEHATDIADDMDVWPATVRMHLRGEKCEGDPDTPPLYFDSGSDQCWKLKEEQQAEELEQSTLEEQGQEEQEQDTPDFEPSPVTQESSTDYTKYISIVAAIYMVYRLIRRLF